MTTFTLSYTRLLRPASIDLHNLSLCSSSCPHTAETSGLGCEILRVFCSRSKKHHILTPPQWTCELCGFNQKLVSEVFLFFLVDVSNSWSISFVRTWSFSSCPPTVAILRLQLSCFDFRFGCMTANRFHVVHSKGRPKNNVTTTQHSNSTYFYMVAVPLFCSTK